MKTIEELYNEVLASEALKKEFLAITKTDDIEKFAEKHGCKATLEEIKTFITEKQSVEGELSGDELDQVAGGKSGDLEEALLSIFSIGVGCALAVVMTSLGGGNVGTAIEGSGMLCDICQ